MAYLYCLTFTQSVLVCSQSLTSFLVKEIISLKHNQKQPTCVLILIIWSLFVGGHLIKVREGSETPSEAFMMFVIYLHRTVFRGSNRYRVHYVMGQDGWITLYYGSCGKEKGEWTIS